DPVHEVVAELAVAGLGPDALLRVDLVVGDVAAAAGVHEDVGGPLGAHRAGAVAAGLDAQAPARPEGPPVDPGRGVPVQGVEETQGHRGYLPPALRDGRGGRQGVAALVDQDQDAGQVGEAARRVE